MASHTRSAILKAALDLMTNDGDGAATMAAIARSANISRQAVYLHYADRDEILVDLADSIETHQDDWLKRIEQSESAVEMLRAMTELHATGQDKYMVLLRAVDAARIREGRTQALWQKRFAAKVEWCELTVVKQLADEGRMHPSWDPHLAAVLICELMSFRVWEDLTGMVGLSAEQAGQVLVSTVIGAMGVPAETPEETGKRPAPARGPKRAGSNGAVQTG